MNAAVRHMQQELDLTLHDLAFAASRTSSTTMCLRICESTSWHRGSLFALHPLRTALRHSTAWPLIRSKWGLDSISAVLHWDWSSWKAWHWDLYARLYMSFMCRSIWLDLSWSPKSHVSKSFNFSDFEIFAMHAWFDRFSLDMFADFGLLTLVSTSECQKWRFAPLILEVFHPHFIQVAGQMHWSLHSVRVRRADLFFRHSELAQPWYAFTLIFFCASCHSKVPYATNHSAP